MSVKHKKDSYSGNSGGGMMGLFFVTSNLCGKRISKTNKWETDAKKVTCKKCLKLLKEAP